MARSSFRASVWDPLLIIAQIVCLQSLFYIGISLLLLVALAITGAELSLDAILNDQEIRTDTSFGWELAFVWLVNAFLGIPILVFIVQRAKLVLDFVITLHGIHLILVWINTHRFPNGLPWWVLQVVSIIIMTLGGEWACMRREMEPIMVATHKREPTDDEEEEIEQTQPSAMSSSSMADDPGLDWVQVSKKRKTSDPAFDMQHTPSDHAPFTVMVNKAKNALFQGAQKAAVSRKNGNMYENIPMQDVDEPGRSS